ncbi:MAG: hypothetical protein ACE5JA_03135 [bacterium]
MEMKSPPSIELKYGIPGLLATSGIALLAISVFNTVLFRPGVVLLLLGILSFFVKKIFHAVGDFQDYQAQEGYVEDWQRLLVVLYIIGLIVLGGIILLLFWPLF